MATVNFYLENRKHKGELKQKNVPVVCHFHFDGRKMILGTGIKVDRKHWRDNRKSNSGQIIKVQRLKTQAPGSQSINAKLDHLAERLNTIYRQAEMEGIAISKNHIKEKLKPQSD